MRLLLSLSISALLAVVPSRAQPVEAPLQVEEGPRALHVTEVINRRPEAREALKAYQLRVNAAPTLSKTSTIYQIGQTQTFKVFNVEASKSGTRLDAISFTLMSQAGRFRLWVETVELQNGHVREQDVAALYEALSRRTPDRSIAPSSGILANDETLFGIPPDVDGDDATDVLLVDIRDGYEPGRAYVAGFVWHGDLDPQGSKGNGRDVLYIDTYPGLYRDGVHRGTARAEATAAHEYQHLIHLSYDTEELTFVNEGLSEWAEGANGYVEHPVSYLMRPSAHGVGLLDWHDLEPQLRDADYERAQLFTTYLAQRVGADALNRLVDARSGGKPLSGAAGYRALTASAGLDLRSVLTDFHTANAVNDRSVDPDFGYADPTYGALPYMPTRSFDGRDGLSSRTDDLALRPGGAAYLAWRHVADFQFSTSTSLRIRAVGEHTDGRVTVQDFRSGLHTLKGDFRRITLVVVHDDLGGGSASLSLDAVWKEGGTSGLRFEEQVYDNGEAVHFYKPSGGADVALATRFAVPDGDAALSSVRIAPYFANQFVGSFLPDNAARDLEVRIWAAQPGGEPGEEILSIPITDPRPFASAARALAFFEVDLAPYESALDDLPDSIFVGLVNAGDDANFLVAAVSPHADESLSYTGNLATGTWKALWNVQLMGSENPYPMRETVVPIRAEFVVTGRPHTGDSDLEMPSRIALDQNYPNPFNPTSTIAYHLEEAANVRLAVYDMTGRRIAVLEDGLQAAGSHAVDVDASRWASGVYAYVLESGGRRLTRTMILSK